MKASRLLKEVLRAVLKRNLFSNYTYWGICANIREVVSSEALHDVLSEFKKFRKYAKDYAPDYYFKDFKKEPDWWWFHDVVNEDNNQDSFILSEKRRFIQDLIDDKFHKKPIKSKYQNLFNLLSNVNPKWVITQIKNHYIKWKDYISCNFNIN